VLSITIKTPLSAEKILEVITTYLAETSFRLWPFWYHGSGTKFDICQNNSLGCQAAGVLVNEVAQKIPGVLPLWAEQAVLLTLGGKLPRITSIPVSTEFEQLAKVIAPDGLVLALSQASENIKAHAEAFVHAVEWIAKTCGVVALFERLPANEPPFDRILYGARVVSPDQAFEATDPTSSDDLWIEPWRGMPHPLSDIEKRLAKAIAADEELKGLFRFNQSIITVRGSRPKVDLLWAEGRLVVELDGYGSHGNRTAFAQDRHRDYELMLSGYAVLRLTNVEIAQDCEKALEKIRDLVRLRYQTLTKEV
jgi:very-short-patch-repair endonuclease